MGIGIFVTFSSFLMQHYAPFSQMLVVGLLLLNFHSCSTKCFLSLFFFFWLCFLVFPSTVTTTTVIIASFLSTIIGAFSSTISHTQVWIFSSTLLFFYTFLYSFFYSYGTIDVGGYCLRRRRLF